MMTSRFYLLPFIHSLNLPPRFLRWLVDIVPWKNLHTIRDIVDVMHSTAVDVVERKRKAIRDGVSTSSQVGRGKDIMSILSKRASVIPRTEINGENKSKEIWRQPRQIDCRRRKSSVK